jgi:hypothetical protein
MREGEGRGRGRRGDVEGEGERKKVCNSLPLSFSLILSHHSPVLNKEGKAHMKRFFCLHDFGHTVYHKRHPLQGTPKGTPPFHGTHRLVVRLVCRNVEGKKMEGDHPGNPTRVRHVEASTNFEQEKTSRKEQLINT